MVGGDVEQLLGSSYCVRVAYWPRDNATRFAQENDCVQAEVGQTYDSAYILSGMRA